MKRIRFPLLLLGLLVILSACSEKPEDVSVTPEQVLLVKRWAKAIKNLNYKAYRMTEANPMTGTAFRHRYDNYYFSDLQVNHVIPPDENDVRKGPDGRPFIWSDVRFQCKQVDRESGRIMTLVQGDVRCIRYIRNVETGEKGPWKLQNRTFLRMPEGSTQ